MMINHTRIMVVRKPTYKKWWLDFQGIYIYIYIIKYIFIKGVHGSDRNLLINGIYWGYNPLILTIDPNFQQDIQVVSKLVYFTYLYRGRLTTY